MENLKEVRNSNGFFSKRIAFAILLLFNITFIFAQSYGDYFRRYDVYGGLNYVKTRTYYYGEKYPKTPSSPAVFDTVKGGKSTTVCPLVGLGLNLPFFKFGNDNMSVGAHIGANVSFGAGTLFLNAPLGLQYRFGTDATNNGDKSFGFALGAGYNLFLMSGDVGEGYFKYPYLSPEINFETGTYGLMKIKAYFQFTEQYKLRQLDTQTLHTYMKVPVILAIGFCPNFDN